MGNVDRLRSRVEPFICPVLGAWHFFSQLCPPARHHSTALNKACPYMVIAGSILNDDTLALLFSYLGMLFIYGFCNSQNIFVFFSVGSRFLGQR